LILYSVYSFTKVALHWSNASGLAVSPLGSQRRLFICFFASASSIFAAFTSLPRMMLTSIWSPLCLLTMIVLPLGAHISLALSASDPSIGLNPITFTFSLWSLEHPALRQQESKAQRKMKRKVSGPSWRTSLYCSDMNTSGTFYRSSIQPGRLPARACESVISAGSTCVGSHPILTPAFQCFPSTAALTASRNDGGRPQSMPV
jgi:hypothetical protein